MEMKTNNAVAVIIGDIHFTPSTLDLASSSLNQALDKARVLQVPIIINGDTLDTKAIIRAECSNRLIEILSTYNQPEKVYINIGNHDRLNEKSSEHSLTFLDPYCRIVNLPIFINYINAWVIPYQNDNIAFLNHLNSIPRGSTIIIHQGLKTAYMGHYLLDTTSLDPDVFKDYRVIASHYHKKQDIKCGKITKGLVGLFSYIGNPYTLSFGEGNDLQKGFAILNSDGSLEHVPTNLRKHVVIDCSYKELSNLNVSISNNDLLYLKIRGSKEELSQVNKKILGEKLIGHESYKLELITEDINNSIDFVSINKKTSEQLLDLLIDSKSISLVNKIKLKEMWRKLLS